MVLLILLVPKHGKPLSKLLGWNTLKEKEKTKRKKKGGMGRGQRGKKKKKKKACILL